MRAGHPSMRIARCTELGDGAQACARLNVTWTTPLGEAVVSIA